MKDDVFTTAYQNFYDAIMSATKLEDDNMTVAAFIRIDKGIFGYSEIKMVRRDGKVILTKRNETPIG